MNDLETRSLTYATEYGPTPSPFACTPEVAAERKARDFEIRCQLALVEWIKAISHKASEVAAPPPLVEPTTPGKPMAMTNAPADTRRRLDTRKDVKPATLPNEGRRQTVTQRALSFELTSSKSRGGVGVFRLVTQDGKGTHTNEFNEFDVKLRQALDDIEPLARVQRGAHYKIDCEITWQRVGGWPTVVSYKENAMTNQTADPSILDEALGRNPDDCAPWVNDDRLRDSFFGDYKNLCNKYQVEPDKDKREAIRKAVLKRRTGQDTLKAWKTTTTALLAELEIELRRLGYKVLDQTTGKPATGEKPTMPKTEPTTALETTKAKSEPMPQSEPTKPSGGDIPHGEVANVSTVDEPLIDKAQFRKERTINISGQKYLKAGDRVVMFRADHPDWTLETEAVQLLPDFAVFKAWIKDSTGKVVSTAHGYCTPDLAKKVSGRFVEKAETAAIARALALSGYGTDDTLDDSDYLSDSPIAKAA